MCLCGWLISYLKSVFGVNISVITKPENFEMYTV
jgi:hypothetical protein